VKDGERVRADALLTLSEHAHHVRMDDQIIVADMRSGHYFGLDGVGARVWELLGQRATRNGIIDRLLAEYEVSRDVLERDVESLLRDLLDRRLVERDRDSAVTPQSPRTPPR
jgi:hypothetical protein